ncbi:hypothetical protein [Mesorhizobium sp. J428]|uniref:hypothetical protein n=1 Tax=Mesorhizobium sp. J428 TaxID=2898440 RepID=UPI0021514FCB|nr:hypothetical protein [Mesorhizobium sp. J428]MCR5859081.1 hypothetical protein [Mesorhizobium sp. J428]
MGSMISWIAFKDMSVTEAAVAFGLTLSGQSGEVFDYDVSATRSGDWSIVVFNDINLDLAAETELARLSRRGDILVVHVNETTMMQTSEQWRNGRQVWSVWHDAQIDPRHLEEEGNLPPAYDGIERRRMAEQDEEDAGDASVDFVSEIPLDLAEDVTRFRYDRSDSEFFELVPGGDSLPKKTSFFGSLKSMFR